VLLLAIGTGVALSYLNKLPDADAKCKVGGGMCSP
jgi:hypothetical protein